MDGSVVLYEKAADARVVTVTVNRPDKLNALDAGVFDALEAAFARARTDPDCGVVILTGAGRKAFVAGADIQELVTQGVFGGRTRSRRGQEVMLGVERLGKPVIGMINGYALGGGLELALACHLRTMAAEAKIGVPEVGLGIIPGYGATQRLPRLVGRARALELILTGDPIDAETALAFGLANRVAPAAELRGVTEALARRLLERGPLALRHALEAVLRGEEVPLDEGLRVEADLFGITSETKDMQEGTRAFVEKRKPEYRGE